MFMAHVSLSGILLPEISIGCAGAGPEIVKNRAPSLSDSDNYVSWRIEDASLQKQSASAFHQEGWNPRSPITKNAVMNVLRHHELCEIGAGKRVLSTASGRGQSLTPCEANSWCGMEGAFEVTLLEMFSDDIVMPHHKSERCCTVCW
jgi:hypothetical protein